ncbi:M56 family metallopeptidase [uncultured Oscillibacter sp.]|uniref:M56 family metallopeptidase n=2 Tax=uncultured Oscillibacter sp. TaxID=876091 RepID=UPI00263155C6|nr:M56 family metallopeptidase [uncultured Oscillibacter sp.]
MNIFLWNWIRTASLLILAVLLLRAAFGRRISARLRYALWAVVLARLLVPGQFFTAPVEAPRVLPELSVIQTLPRGPQTPVEKIDSAQGDAAGQAIQALPAPAGEEAAAPAARRPLNPRALLGGIWLAGSAAMAAAFLLSNLSFARRLRRLRVPLAAECPLPVYTLAGLPSPCLSGVFRPAVYVTPETAADPGMLRHVLTHEATHYRQGDHIWSLLRCAALAVHWWNPLAWLAAVLSRRDAELACDEGALKVLGDGERQAYGSTLLALVTVKAQPGDLLRCATTMTGDKRSLRERVRRIARAPKRWLWAAVLSAALALLVCACSFAKSETLETPEDGPLTAEELERFNTEVFNGDGFNMMNQFLFLAVEAPKDYQQIDLFQLFYNGTGEPMEVTEEERQAVAEADYGGEDPMVDLVKCPASEMDAVLRKYLGLTLDETDRWCLDRFTYLEEYDAYYDFHGDTNYPGEVTFISGKWKDGKVLLYYEGSGFPGLSSGNGEMNMVSSGPACVTLEPQRDGGYRFLSNWVRNGDPPVIPTAYPAWEPERVIPLDGVEPYRAPELQVERRGGTAETLYTTRFEPYEDRDDGFYIEVCRSGDGDLYAAVAVSATERDCFLTVPGKDSAGWTADEGGVEPFTNLFGQSGLRISYYGQLAEHSFGQINDYYTFSGDGTPSLLLRAKGDVQAMDLDGDGVDELAASDGESPRLFFLRDGQIYEADVGALVQSAWPEAGYTEYGFWNADSRSLFLSAQVPVPGSADRTASAFRTLFFDGENLRLYKQESGYTDHIANGLETLPADVLAAARDFVQGQFEARAAEGYGNDGSGNYNEENFGPGNAVWDDWRVTGLSGPYYEAAGNFRVEIWNVSYETHTTTPDQVMLAGGSYLGEDGWCMIGYPGCDYLYFQLDEGGNRTYLFSKMENDCSPGTELFLSDMVNTLMEQGLLELTDLDGETLAKIMWPQSAWFLNNLAERAGKERNEVLLFLAGYLSNGGGSGKTYYENFVRELDGGYRAGELTAGGRAAWEKLKDFVRSFDQNRWLPEEEQIPGLPLRELLEFLSKSDGAFTESAVTELHQRFLADPAAVLSALAEREDRETLEDLLAGTIYRDEDLFPGAIEQAKALPPETLDAEQSAVRDRIVSAYEARRLEDAA